MVKRKLKRQNKETPLLAFDRRLKAFVNKAAKEVAKWPDWMKGKPDPK